MPRRLTAQQRRARLSEYLGKLGAEYQDVDALVSASLQKALMEHRRAVAGPQAAGEVFAENVFEAGFLAAALAFWDDIRRSRERLRSAGKGRRRAARDRRETTDDFHKAVRAAATAYRRVHPYDPRKGTGSTRALANAVADTLCHPDRREDNPDATKSASAVRHALRKLGFR